MLPKESMQAELPDTIRIWKASFQHRIIRWTELLADQFVAAALGQIICRTLAFLAHPLTALPRPGPLFDHKKPFRMPAALGVALNDDRQAAARP
jgi:hypothetical protein